MRIAIITEGAYPYHIGSTSTWCHQLVRGLERYTYHVVALTGAGAAQGPLYPLPVNVSSLTPVPVQAAPAATSGGAPRRRVRRAATSAAAQLCRGMLATDGSHVDEVRGALARLADLAAGGTHPLAGVPLAEVLADAWRAADASPRLRRGDAESAAVLLDHALRPLTTAAPAVHLCHPTSGGLPLLIALAAKWRAGIPYLLTEQGIYLRERYVDYGGLLPDSVRAVMLRFLQALARVGYAEAAMVVTATRFNQRWQLQHGADPARVVVVPGGVDPAEYPPLSREPAQPVVTWLGRVEPLKDLTTLIHAFWHLRRRLPTARLRLYGPVVDPAYQDECRGVARRLGLAEAVEFPGPVPHPTQAYAAGQVVVRSSICEGQPYPVVEAMMSGRATVNTDIGGAGEFVGDAGLVVPPGDTGALAEALGTLLQDPSQRRTLGEAAAARSRAQFSLAPMLRAYQRLYTDIAAEHRLADGRWLPAHQGHVSPSTRPSTPTPSRSTAP